MDEGKKFSTKMLTTLNLRKAYAKQFSEGTPLIFVQFGEPTLIDDSMLEKMAKDMDLSLLQVQASDQVVMHFKDTIDAVQWLKDHPITNFPFHAIAMNCDGDCIADNSVRENLSSITDQIKQEEQVKEESNV